MVTADRLLLWAPIVYQPLKRLNYRLLLTIYYYLLDTLNVPKSLIYLLETPLMLPKVIIPPTLYPLVIKRRFLFCVVSIVQSRLYSYLGAVPEQVIGSSGSKLSAAESPKPILAKLLRRDRVGAAVHHGPGRKESLELLRPYLEVWFTAEPLLAGDLKSRLQVRRGPEMPSRHSAGLKHHHPFFTAQEQQASRNS